MLSILFTCVRIWDNVKLALNWSERMTVNPEVVGSIPAKPPHDKNSEDSNLYGFELHRPSSKSTQLLFQVVKAIKKQFFSFVIQQLYGVYCLVIWYLMFSHMLSNL